MVLFRTGSPNLGPFEPFHVGRTARLWPGSRQAFATKRLAADNRADLVAVNIDVAHFQLAGDVLHPAVDARVHTERQAKPGAVYRLDHRVQFIRGKCRHMQHRAKDLLGQIADAANLQYGG